MARQTASVTSFPQTLLISEERESTRTMEIIVAMTRLIKVCRVSRHVSFFS